MDGPTIFIGLVVLIFFLISIRSGSSKRSSGTSNSSYGPVGPPQIKPSTPSQLWAPPSVQQVRIPSASKPITTGFQPEDRCTCGGRWVKRENSQTGGVFFACSRYPKCKNSRDQVLRRRLGSAYSKKYCSRGHTLEVFGTVTDPVDGRSLCKRCLSKGLIQMRRVPAPRESKIKMEQRNLPAKKKNITWQGDDYCRNGHRRTADNIYIRPYGSRECRICRRNARG